MCTMSSLLEFSTLKEEFSIGVEHPLERSSISRCKTLIDFFMPRMILVPLSTDLKLGNIVGASQCIPALGRSILRLDCRIRSNS